MIIKFYEITKPNILKNNFFLFYGENQGLKEEIIEKNFNNFSSDQIFNYNETQILNNKDNFFDEILSESFFEDKKLIKISRASDKILPIIEELFEKKYSDVKIILISFILDKKSKLRKFFEKEKKTISIPFYEDNNQTLSTIAQNFFRDQKIKISQQNINILVERSQGDRINLKNELNKIENFTRYKKKIDTNEILRLTNLSENYKISELVDHSLAKSQKKTITILNENSFTIDDSILILKVFLSKLKRLLKLQELAKINTNIESTISSFKPPIFWKEKEIIKKQMMLLDYKKIQELLIKTNNLELIIKKNPSLSISIISDFILEQTIKTNI